MYQLITASERQAFPLCEQHCKAAEVHSGLLRVVVPQEYQVWGLSEAGCNTAESTAQAPTATADSLGTIYVPCLPAAQCTPRTASPNAISHLSLVITAEMK